MDPAGAEDWSSSDDDSFSSVPSFIFDYTEYVVESERAADEHEAGLSSAPPPPTRTLAPSARASSSSSSTNAQPTRSEVPRSEPLSDAYLTARSGAARSLALLRARIGATGPNFRKTEAVEICDRISSILQELWEYDCQAENSNVEELRDHVEQLELQRRRDRERIAALKEELTRQEMVSRKFPVPSKLNISSQVEFSPDDFRNFQDLVGSSFQCCICYELLISPVTINCGHTFCEDCIDSWKSAHSAIKVRDKCPTCRVRIISRPANVVIRQFLEKAVENFLPDEAKEGRKTLVAEREAKMKEKRREEAKKCDEWRTNLVQASLRHVSLDQRMLPRRIPQSAAFATDEATLNAIRAIRATINSDTSSSDSETLEVRSAVLEGQVHSRRRIIRERTDPASGHLNYPSRSSLAEARFENTWADTSFSSSSSIGRADLGSLTVEVGSMSQTNSVIAGFEETDDQVRVSPVSFSEMPNWLQSLEDESFGE